MRDILKTPMILFLFDGAAGAAAGGEGAGAPGAQGENTGSPAPTRRGKTGEFDNVVFGKQPQPQGAVTSPTQPAAAAQETNGVQTTSDALEAKRTAYRNLVEGEYKDQYTQDIQRIIDRRFKETKTLQTQVDGYQPIIDMLTQRYGVDASDMKALQAAIENDDAYWTEAADEAGMSVQQFKEFQRLERENKALVEQQRRRENQAAVDRTYQKWQAEAEALKQKYAGFDVQKELQNPDFASLLRSGVPMEHAFKVVHMDEMMSDAMSTAAQTVERRVTDTIRARGTRPVENGSAGQSATLVRDDVSKLTKKERQEIARRVGRGETIIF